MPRKKKSDAPVAAPVEKSEKVDVPEPTPLPPPEPAVEVASEPEPEVVVVKPKPAPKKKPAVPGSCEDFDALCKLSGKSDHELAGMLNVPTSEIIGRWRKVSKPNRQVVETLRRALGKKAQ